MFFFRLSMLKHSQVLHFYFATTSKKGSLQKKKKMCGNWTQDIYIFYTCLIYHDKLPLNAVLSSSTKRGVILPIFKPNSP